MLKDRVGEQGEILFSGPDVGWLPQATTTEGRNVTVDLPGKITSLSHLCLNKFKVKVKGALIDSDGKVPTLSSNILLQYVYKDFQNILILFTSFPKRI